MLTKKDLEHLAELARIDLKEDEEPDDEGNLNFQVKAIDMDWDIPSIYPFSLYYISMILGGFALILLDQSFINLILYSFITIAGIILVFVKIIGYSSVKKHIKDHIEDKLIWIDSLIDSTKLSLEEHNILLNWQNKLYNILNSISTWPLIPDQNLNIVRGFTTFIISVTTLIIFVLEFFNS